MTEMPTKNIQSGAPVAESAAQDSRIARADRREGTHYEPDAEQIVKVVHEVTPGALPVEGPTDYARRGGPQSEAVSDVAVSPAEATVWEARPAAEPDV